MTIYDDGPVHEPFGPEYVRPKNADCSDCDCCTAALCAKGRASLSECAGHVNAPELVERVGNCPCSAERTRGTLSWRAAMVRAVTFATEKPLREALEALLARIADGPVDGGLEPLLPKVVVRRYVKWAPGLTPELTDFGRAYLDARRGVPRVESLVLVLSGDEDARTVQAAVPAFSADQLVTVPLDLVANSRTELGPKDLESVTLYAEVNPGAREADDVVLTKVRNPAMAVTARPGSPDGGQ
ncbi:hypothetical protein ABT255_02920 [Streptomyces mirabilis]|uniref:hypothetical protein n=1 Tax=Streptomyces mirabilis TaxID=68239 RepID=UPI0033250FE2